MNLIIKEITNNDLDLYSKIPMYYTVTSKYRLKEVKGGLGGIVFEEIKINEYLKDFDKEETPLIWKKQFDISKWGFFIAFDGEKPIGGISLAYKTEGVNMLSKRKDMTVLWDIRVHPEYKSMEIGTKLFSKALRWSKERNCIQMKIETQNDNIPACHFYAKQGCRLGEIRKYAYYHQNSDDVMLIWYYNIEKI